MTSPSTIIAIVGGLVTAARQAVAFAEQLGIGEDAIERLKRIEVKVNEEAAQLLGPSVIALDLAVHLAAADMSRRIASLGEDPVCPQCKGILTVMALATPGGGPSEKWFSCGACGWKS